MFSFFISKQDLQSFTRLPWKVSSKSRSWQFPSNLDESRSRQPINYPVSTSLGLDNLEILLMSLGPETLEVWISVLMTRTTHWSRWSWSQDHKPGLANLCTVSVFTFTNGGIMAPRWKLWQSLLVGWSVRARAIIMPIMFGLYISGCVFLIRSVCGLWAKRCSFSLTAF